ncbi:MAG: hypothetical protein J5925_06305, partial [Clostridia bacterium]|nr:hypothetical protein [Clostridia bacterium]
MSIIYFDICSIPLFLMILFVCYTRKMTKGSANKLFILMVFLSLFSAMADLGMEIANNSVPLSEAGVILCNVSSYIYLVLRNSTNAALLLFLLALTRTTFLLRKKWAQIVFWLPYAFILVLLAINPINHSSFTVTAESGYARAPMMYVFYAIALLYGLVGFVYCIYCRRYFTLNKWAALLSIYLLNYVAVFIQFLRPEILVEMFCTSLGEMAIMFSIMRPEERMDAEAGMLSWASYQYDLRNIIKSHEHVRIIVMRMPNCREMRNYLGDHEYNRYL